MPSISTSFLPATSAQTILTALPSQDVDQRPILRGDTMIIEALSLLQTSGFLIHPVPIQDEQSEHHGQFFSLEALLRSLPPSKTPRIPTMSLDQWFSGPGQMLKEGGLIPPHPILLSPHAPFSRVLSILIAHSSQYIILEPSSPSSSSSSSPKTLTQGNLLRFLLINNHRLPPHLLDSPLSNLPSLPISPISPPYSAPHLVSAMKEACDATIHSLFLLPRPHTSLPPMELTLPTLLSWLHDPPATLEDQDQCPPPLLVSSSFTLSQCMAAMVRFHQFQAWVCHPSLDDLPSRIITISHLLTFMAPHLVPEAW
ncbi:MAG: hypothetical protein DHS80DRAFT_31124 [Piptocephalis tieghemiana]|nr:MAG: hypothetical protein DHS80DRAFT_31124 [Piptocephalis tieghemiana]